MKIDKLLAIGLACMLLAISFTNAVVGMRAEDLYEDDPIEISDWYDLNATRDELDAHYILVNDLDEETAGYDVVHAEDYGWDPIGDEDDRFAGTFDGNNHEISGLYIDRTDTDYVGLFGYIDDGGKVCNVGVVEVEVSGNQYVGALVGYNWGVVENSYATGNVSGEGWHVGGLVGNFRGTMSNSYADVNVSGDQRVGGLMGLSNYGTVSNSYATGNVDGGSVVGGLVGRNFYGSVENSYAIGNVDGGSDVGGLVGENLPGTVEKSFYHEDMPECSVEGYGSLPLSDDEFNSISTFESAGWDIETVDTDRDRPFLYYEKEYGEDHVWLIQESVEEHTLTIEIDGEGSTDPPEGQYDHSKHGKIVIEAIHEEGHYFVNWTGDEESSDPVIVLTMDEDKTITANFEPLDYEISNWKQLHNIRYDLGEEYTLEDDLDEHSEYYDEYASSSANDGEGWLPIGDEDDGFTGRLKGDGFSISDLYIERGEEQFVGLFGVIENEGAVEELHIENMRIESADSSVGSIVGENHGTISDSSATGEAEARGYLGGLAGRNYGEIYGSYAVVDLSTVTFGRTGGLVGENDGEILDSYAAGNVSSTTNLYLGGLVGNNPGSVENSHYNIDETLIQGENHVTQGGLFEEQFQDWIENKELDINNYSDSLIPVGDHYEISDVQGILDLLGFADREGYEFQLVDDIDLSASEGLFIPQISADFDGDGFMISNLNLNIPFAVNVGMFGHVTEEASISNVIISSGEVIGLSRVGGLVGINHGTISSSSSVADVEGNWEIGGLVGENHNTVSNSYATGAVAGDQNVGGLVGSNRWDGGEVSKSYSTGSVEESWNVGGLVGINDGTVDDSFWDVETSGQSDSAGGEGKTTEEMMDISTFTDAGWDIKAVVDPEYGYKDHIWNIVDTETYPFFSSTVSELRSVSTWEDLHNIRYDMTVSYVLMNDLTPECEGYDQYASSDADEGAGWLPIGDENKAFDGTFFGNGYTIEGLNINRSDNDYIGLFGNVNGMIEQLTLADADITGDETVGILAGYVGENGEIYETHTTGEVVGVQGAGGLLGENNGVVSNCSSAVEVEASESSSAGLIAENKGVIENSYATGDVNGEDQVGGLVGRNDGKVENSYSTGTVSGDDERVGGLMGRNDGKVENSYATGKVSGNRTVGGLVGWNRGTINNSYATGNVSGYRTVGGLVGSNEDTLSNSYATGTVSCEYLYAGGLVGYNGGTVENSYATGTVSCEDWYAGGLLGSNTGTLSNSYATGNVIGGDRHVGGLLGYNWNGGTVSNSYATGDASGTGSYVGGLVGQNFYGLVENSYATGNVSGKEEVGGLVGYNEEDGTVNNSYATGLVIGDSEVGGLVGNNTGTVDYCFWDNRTSGLETSDGGEGRNTMEMMIKSTFTDAGWDFDNIWWMVDGQTRPFLQMEWSTEISNSHQLQMMAMDLTDDYTLACDIDLSGYITEPNRMWGTSPTSDGGFVPVGTGSDRFESTLDGRKHTITGLYINRSETNDVGLFGVLETNGLVKDVCLLDNNITGNWQVGALVGDNYGSVVNSYATGSVSGVNYVGGLVGLNRGNVSNSYATGDVSGDLNYVGGLVGENRDGMVENSYATGDVSGDNMFVGGLVGWNNEGTVLDSYATGDVSGVQSVGGLVGENFEDSDSTVENSYATGIVTGERRVGGLIGSNMRTNTIERSYATGNVSGEEEVGGLVGYNDGMVEDSYATVTVTRVSDSDHENFGGFVGANWDGEITNCYSTGQVIYEETEDPTDKGFAGFVDTPQWMTGNFWDNETSRQSSSAGEGIGNNVEGRNTTDMMIEETFTDADWDFEEIWWMMEGETYPLLRWSPAYNVDSEMSFRSIQSSIVDRETSEGDTIVVSPGTFNENIMMDKPIRLIGSGIDESIIDAQGDGFGILVMANDTLVRGFTLENATSGDPGAGIVIVDPSNGGGGGPPEDPHPLYNITLDQVRSTDNNNSVIMINVHESEVTNSELTNSTDFDLLLMESNDNTIEDNTLKNGHAGMVLRESHDNKIYGNDASSHFISIALYRSNDNELDDNKITDNERTGIDLDRSVENVLTNNVMVNTSIHIVGEELNYWNTHEIDHTNTVNGSPVRYLTDQSGEEITGDEEIGQLILANCEEITIDGLELSNTKDSILIGFSTDLTITNNTLHDNHQALVLILSDDNTIDGNDFLDNDVGMVVGLSDSNTIVNNTFSENENGIIIMEESEDNLIYQNAFMENDRHARLRDAGDNSWDAGYPTGGNYWDDHTEPDDWSGPEQDVWGSDGIVDDELVIDGDGNGNVDNYPWTNPEFKQPITIYRLSPADEYTDVPLDTKLSALIETETYPVDVYFYLDDVFVDSETIDEDGSVETSELDLEYGTEYEWYVVAEGGNSRSVSQTHTFTTLSGYNLTVNIEGEGTVEVKEDEVEDGWTNMFGDGEEVELTAIPEEGYHFSHWEGDVPEGEEEQETINVTMDKDKILTAHFSINEYNLTINIQGKGSTVPEEGNHTYEHGEFVEVEAIEDVDGWNFKYWEGDVTPLERWEDTMNITMDGDKEITAVFTEEVFYTLTINIIGEGTVKVDGVEVEDGWTNEYVDGTTVDLEAIPDEDYFFSQWSGYHSDTDNKTEVLMNRNRSIFASFTEEEPVYYTLTINIEGDGMVNVDIREEVEDGWTNNYSDGTMVYLEAIPDEDYFFSQWLGDHTGSDDKTEVRMDRNRTITAVFTEEEPVYYTLTIIIEGDGIVEVDGVEVEDGWTDNYPEGTTVNLEAIPGEDSFFAQWEGDHTGIDKETDVTMNRNREITARFTEEEPVYYTLTINIEGDGMVEVDGEEVEDGWTNDYLDETSIDIKAIPDEGWEFDEWEGTDETGEEITVEMNEDKTITAIFIDEDEVPDDDEEESLLDPMMIALIAVALAVIGGLIFFAMKKKPSGKPSSESEEDIDRSEEQESDEETMFDEGEEVDTFEEELEEVDEEMEEIDEEIDKELEEELDELDKELEDIDEELEEEVDFDEEEI